MTDKALTDAIARGIKNLEIVVGERSTVIAAIAAELQPLLRERAVNWLSIWNELLIFRQMTTDCPECDAPPDDPHESHCSLGKVMHAVRSAAMSPNAAQPSTPASERWEFGGPEQWDSTCANNHRPIQLRQVDGLDCPLCAKGERVGKHEVKGTFCQPDWGCTVAQQAHSEREAKLREALRNAANANGAPIASYFTLQSQIKHYQERCDEVAAIITAALVKP
jgi:hypothetical protein